MDMSQPSSSGYPSSGYHTPSSAVYEGRRDSIASMQSSTSYAHSFSSNGSSYCSTQMPPTPHSSRETIPGDWPLVNSGLSFENSTTQEAPGHDFGEFGADGWENHLPLVSKPRTVAPARRPDGWVLVEPTNLESAFRMTGSDNDAMMPASTDLRSAFESSMGSQSATRSLEPAPEIYTSSELWNMQHATTLGYSMQGLTAGAYDDAPINTTVGLDYWHGGSNTHFDLPTFEHGATLVQPSETFVAPEDRSFDQIHSDSFEDSLGSFGGYSSSTSPCSIGQPRIKEERDDEFDRAAKRTRNNMESPTRRDSRKEKRPTGVIKRKRLPNQLDTYYARLDESGCPVEVKCQTGLEKDPLSGRLISATGETKKQRCRFEGCVKTFARPEHLKRHENTHSKERPFPCVVPCCRRRFSRNDNRKAHYETHLKEALSGKKARNASVSFEDLCMYLTREEPEEEARKMIEKLQNPKSKNKMREA